MKNSLIVVGLIALGACSQRDGGDSVAPLVSVVEATATECPQGGAILRTGLDYNGNGTLDEEEEVSSQAVCNASPSSGSVAQLFSVEGATAEECPWGGVMLLSGEDQNGNGALDSEEAVNKESVCYGEDATIALQLVSVVAANDAQCPGGGMSIRTGYDNNSNKVLDEDEIDSTDNICIPAERLYLTEVQQGNNECPFGAVLEKYGYDDNFNGLLDDVEVKNSKLMCLPEYLIEVADEPMCFPGGSVMSAGSDRNGNGRLEPLEITSSELLDCVYLRSTDLAGTASTESNASVGLGKDGSVFVVGSTDGVIGEASAGGVDIFVRKKGPISGEVVWTRQFGTIKDDLPRAVAVGASGAVFVVGQTSGNFSGIGIGGKDGFLLKIDSMGNEAWSSQFGTIEDDEATAVALDKDGNIFVLGTTRGDMAGSSGLLDGFLKKYSTTGQVLWTKQFGNSNMDFFTSLVVLPNGDAIVMGHTPGVFEGPLTNGGTDIMAARYSSDGAPVWRRQFGASGDELLWGAALMPGDTILMVGETESDWFGYSAAEADGASSQSDAVVMAMSADGELLSGQQWGTAAYDRFSAVAVDNYGTAVIVGESRGSLFGANPMGHLQPVVMVFDDSMATMQLPYSADVSGLKIAAAPQWVQAETMEAERAMVLVGVAEGAGIDGLTTAGSDLFVSQFLAPN